MGQIAAGNEDAFASLFEKYKQQVYAYAMHVTRSTIYSEEIVQDVFVKIWTHRKKLPLLDNFEPYLYVMARNFSFNVLKKIAHEAALKNGWYNMPAVSSESSEAPLLEKELKVVLQQALEELPPQQKLVYHLRREHYLGNEEVATQLKISKETVKSHLKQAMRSIRKYLDDRKKTL